MANNRSNAPGFGSGNGTLKSVKISRNKKQKIYLPRVPTKSY